MRRRITLALAGAALALTVAAPAAFASPPHEACWGVVTQQLATTSQGIGDHASAQDTPRLGLGNAARAFINEDAKVYDLGTLLASIDGSGATYCP